MTKGYLLMPKQAARFSSHRFPQRAFSNVAYKEDGIKELADILPALENMKQELKSALKKETDADISTEIQKAIAKVDKDLLAINRLPDDMKAEDVTKWKGRYDELEKGFDALQLQFKELKQTGPINRDNNPFMDSLKAGIAELKNNILGDGIKGGKFTTEITLKAVGDMTIAANLSGAIPNTYRNEIVPVPFEMVHFRSLVNVTPSETDSYHFYRHSIGEGSIEFQNQELETKAQFDEDLTEVTVNLNYLAGWLRISKKMLRNFKGLQGYLSRWIPERYYEREDTKAYQALISGATGTPVVGVNIMDSIIRTIGLMKKNKERVTGIVMDGAVWANILTYKGSTSGEYTMPIGVVTISPTGQLMILGIPVYTASWVGGDEILIGDWSMFEIIQSEGLSLQFFEQDGTNVRENKITARIEACVGFALLRTTAFTVLAIESVS